MVPYEVTFYTGDVADAGTDSQIFIKVFGVKGSSSNIFMDKMSERFERGKVDLIKVILMLTFITENIYSPMKHGRTVNNTNQIKTKQLQSG